MNWCFVCRRIYGVYAGVLQFSGMVSLYAARIPDVVLLAVVRGLTSARIAASQHCALVAAHRAAIRWNLLDGTGWWHSVDRMHPAVGVAMCQRCSRDHIRHLGGCGNRRMLRRAGDSVAG